MALTPIGLGSSPNDGNGDTLRAGGAKVNLIVSTMWDTVSLGLAYLLGKVGIGAATPRENLHIHELTAGGCWARFTNTDTGSATGDGLRIGITSGEEAAIWNFENTPMRFANNNLEVARFTSGGNFGIDKTTPNSKLAVSGLPVYATNAAALVGGLTEGDFYKTASTGDATLMVVNTT